MHPCENVFFPLQPTLPRKGGKWKERGRERTREIESFITSNKSERERETDFCSNERKKKIFARERRKRKKIESRGAMHIIFTASIHKSSSEEGELRLKTLTKTTQE